MTKSTSIIYFFIKVRQFLMLFVACGFAFFAAYRF